MTTVAQHITENSLHGLGTNTSLCKGMQVDERVPIKSISHFPPVTDKSSPPVVSKKPERKVSKSNPPTAPKRSSSISVIHEPKGSPKEKVHFASVKDESSNLVYNSSMNKYDGQIVSRESKVSPRIEHAQKSSKDRGVSPIIQEFLNSSHNNGVKDGIKMRSILSISQAQSDNLLKPRDRIRSILVSDSNEDGEANFEDGYGSSYNASLMKISHGDVQKHTVAVTTPRVPSISPCMSQNLTDFDSNISESSQEITDHSPVKKKEELFPLKRPRSCSSPFDLQREKSNDIANTDANNPTFSNPIARAYRQHLETRLEKDKQLGPLDKRLQNSQKESKQSKSSLRLDKIGVPEQPIQTSTALRKSSSQLQSTDDPCDLSPLKYETPVPALTSSTNNVFNNGQQNITPTNVPMQMQHGVQKSSYIRGQDLVRASSGEPYGTLPHLHRYQQLYASKYQILKGEKEMRKRATSINNLMIESGRDDEQQPLPSQQSYNSHSPDVSHKLQPFQRQKNVDGTGELEKRKRNSNEFKFSDYISYHSAHFPKRVQITKGTYGNSEEAALSQGEVFDLHFVYQTKSVMMADSDQIQYILPMSTLAMLSILYDPFSVEKVAVFGFHFKTAGAVMDLKNPPTVMASTRTIDGGSSESSLEKGEILIFQGVKNVFYGRLLKVFSVKTNLMKFLDDQCTADFTTDPAMIKMTLPQIYDCSIPLPQKIILHPSNESANFIPISLQEHALMLKKFSVSKFVVATAYPSSEMPSSSECSILDLDVSLDLDIQEVLTVEDEVKQMQQATEKLVNKFDERAVIPYVNMPNPSLHGIQIALLRNLDSKSTPYTSEILPPDGVTLPKVQKPRQKDMFNSLSKLKQTPDNKMELRLTMIEAKQVKIEAKVSSICDRLDDISCKMDKVHTYLCRAQLAMNEHKRKESIKDQPVSNIASGNLPISSESFRFDINPTSSLPNDSSFTQPILVQGKSRRPISELHGKRACKSMSDDNDEIFVVKSAKPPIRPKPKHLIKKTKAQTTTVFYMSQKDKETKKKEPLKRSSRSLLSMNEDGERSGGSTSSDTTTLPASSKPSWRTSVDLSEYLLPESPSRIIDKPIHDQTCCSSVQSQSSKESRSEEEFLNGNIDKADWYSQIEEELTKLYNNSILSL